MSTKSNEAKIVRLEERVLELEMEANRLRGMILVLQERSAVSEQRPDLVAEAVEAALATRRIMSWPS